MKRIKTWFIDSFLPMWAKQTVLADNRTLQKEVERLREEIARKEAYIKGLETGVKSVRRIVINNGGDKA